MRRAWQAADNAQVHFVYFIEQSELLKRNWDVGQMRAFNGTEATIEGLSGGQTYYFAVRGMRWDFGEFKAVWGSWLYWEAITPAGDSTSSAPAAAKLEPDTVGTVTDPYGECGWPAARHRSSHLECR